MPTSRADALCTISDSAAASQEAAAPPCVAACIGDDEAAAWDVYARAAPNSSLYHHYAWRTLIREIFGHEAHYLAARNGAGEIVGILPLVRLRSRLFGDFLVSMPYFNYGGVVAGSTDAAGQLLAQAAALSRSLGAAHLEMRHIEDLAPGWPTRTDKVTMLLELPRSPEALQKQVSSKLRSQIKRPIREGAVCTDGGSELLGEFYAVFARNMRDLGTPVYPRRFFARILEVFPNDTRIFLVRLRGKAVAASLTVAHRRTLEVPWASSLREANALSVNMLLYWGMLEYACQRGFAVFDFGRSTLDSGTYRFKQQWGAQPRQLHWQYWLRTGTEPPRINPANPKYRAAIALWQRLPVPIANLLGPLLVGNLP